MKLQPRQVLKIISAGIFLVVLVLIAANFATRPRRQIKIPKASQNIESQKIDRKEKVEIIEFEGGKGRFMGRADRHYIGEDNLYHLEGNVEIALPERSEGEDILLRGKEIIHNTDLTYFWLRGKATVQSKGLTLWSSVIEYDAEEQIFKTEEGFRFSSENLSGEAQKCVYFLREKKVVLEGNIFMEIWPNVDSPVPLQIETDFFEYYTGKGRGKAEGAVMLTHGKSIASAEYLNVQLMANREQIKSLYLKKNVRITLRDEFEEEKTLSGLSSFRLYGDRCEIHADEIFVKGFQDLPQIQSLQADGNCLFKFLSSSGDFTQIRAERIKFSLSQNGRLKVLSAFKKVRMTEKELEKEYYRSIDGQTVLVQGNEKIMQVKGGDEERAVIQSQDSEISAKSLTLYLKENDVEAAENVKVVFFAREETQQGVGFLSKEKPVFITADSMRFFDKPNRFLFKGKIRLWQTKKTLECLELSIGVDSGAFHTKGIVKSVLPCRFKDQEKEEKIAINAESLDYDPDSNSIVYRKKVVLEVKNVTLKAQRLRVNLDEESKNISCIVAEKEVVIVQNMYEGRGGRATVEVEKEVITLVEDPIFIDKKRGQTEGSKLTFYMADDRIVIENKDRERSETVIKS